MSCKLDSGSDHQNPYLSMMIRPKFSLARMVGDGMISLPVSSAPFRTYGDVALSKWVCL